ncbi:hypothetical protein SCLARK_001510 [Spiroplasma clarkii]|uniref:hypothetical protein n=1 Tax=Spiroplasma clarkii TaxID=2139 RepID=UPI000B573ED9|nr:hypothetical protein [Spiroplasma clarkii]ARU92023.1 hypothetical protein SCLARK_001510 [Spiroplasma clarkii]
MLPIAITAFGITPITQLSTESWKEKDYVRIVLTKNYNYDETDRVDAGTGDWAWNKTSQAHTIFTNNYTIDFQKEQEEYPSIFQNMVVEFDISGSMVDIYYKN